MPENEFENTPRLPSEEGRLQVRLLEGRTMRPVAGARIEISYEGDPESEIRQYTTDESGMTQIITLPAPAELYSTRYSEQQPYAEYTIRASAEGYEDVEVAGTEILPDVLAIQEIHMPAAVEAEDFVRIVIGPHTLLELSRPRLQRRRSNPRQRPGRSS